MNTRVPGMLVIALAAMPVTSWAQRPVAEGPEFPLNTYTEGGQRRPAVVLDASGRFVAVWDTGGVHRCVGGDDDGQPCDPGQSLQCISTGGECLLVGLDGSSTGVATRLFDSQGMADEIEFLANTFTPRSQEDASIAMGPDGRFVVAWQSFLQEMTPSGDFTGAWGVFARRFDASGTPDGAEFQVNTFQVTNQTDPAVAVAGNGNFLIVWESFGQDAEAGGIFGQLYDPSGAPIGGEFQVNSTGRGRQADPRVAADTDGRFVVAWHDLGVDRCVDGPNEGARCIEELDCCEQDCIYPPGDPPICECIPDTGSCIGPDDGNDGSGTGIFAQRYDSTGAPVDGEFLVTTTTAGDQSAPALGMDAGGNFVIAWSEGYFDRNGVFLQRFDAQGERIGAETRVDTRFFPLQSRRPVAAVAPSGELVVIWEGNESTGQNTSRKIGLVGQAFTAGGRPVGVEFPVAPPTYPTADDAAMNGAGNLVAVYDRQGESYGRLFSTPEPTLVEIDVKPGSSPNSVNPSSGQSVSVGIFTTSTFDATTIDPLTVRFGSAGAREVHGRGHIVDVDRDGDDDLLVHFAVAESGIRCGDGDVILTGETTTGEQFEAIDTIQTTGCH